MGFEGAETHSADQSLNVIIGLEVNKYMHRNDYCGGQKI